MNTETPEKRKVLLDTAQLNLTKCIICQKLVPEDRPMMVVGDNRGGRQTFYTFHLGCWQAYKA
jgi:hypothetical protein